MSLSKNLRPFAAVLYPTLLAGCTANPETAASAPPANAMTPLAGATQPATVPLDFNGKMGPGVKISPVGLGWAKTSVNAVIFRASSVVTHGDTQYIGYYDGDSNLVLGKRKVNAAQWETMVTPYKGNVKDAHNSISLGVDGNNVLHVSWDMHGNKLRYARGTAPGSLQLSAEMPMTGQHEDSVTYPQFYALPSGDLLFLYRAGASGNGNVMLNRYDVKTSKWRVVHHPLIDGEGKRNGYTNILAVDSKGGMHLSWVWRESPDVASNHDICYAFSPDQGETWQKSTGQKYTLPITAATAEIAWPVPQKSELINQTSMTVDGQGHPMIATYWRDAGSQIPQFRLVWHDGTKWRQQQVGNRTLPFSLGGSGTKRIPISRPQIVAGPGNEVCVIFRDAERGSDISAAVAKDAEHTRWNTVDLYQEPIRGLIGVGTWGTQAEFKDIRVTRGKKALFAGDFSKDLSGFRTQGGDWKATGGVLSQNSDADNVRAVVGDAQWSDYTLSLKARKTGGKEGFLIIFGAPGDDTKSWWNLGGWGNTKNALEIPGVPSQQVPGSIETGRWYDIRIELKGPRVQCFLDGKLMQSGTRSTAWEPSYDPELWRREHRLNLFWQNVGQGDGESLENIPPQPVGVLEWKP
jgi:hypothetical protein